MKKLILLTLLVSIATAVPFIPYAGMGMHTKRFETVPTKADSPMGLFGVETGYDYVSVGIHHISSIPNVGSETRGLNLLDLKLKYRYGDSEIYVARSIHSEEFDGTYYSKQFSKQQNSIGFNQYYDDKVLFIQYLDSTEDTRADMMMYGFKQLFKGW